MWLVDEAFILDVKLATAIQDLRINVGNRIYAYLVEGLIRTHKDYDKLLQMRRGGAPPKETAKYMKKLLAESLKEQGLTMEKFKEIFEANKNSNLIYVGLKKLEAESWKSISRKVKSFPIWEWFKKVRGIDTKLAAQIIAKVRDIRRFPNPSKLKAYLGVAPKLKKQRGVKASFDPEAKGLMLGRVADCLLRAKSPYKKIYDEKKQKYIREHPEWSKMKMHNHAKKAMTARFIIDMWVIWYRTLGMEPPCTPYIANLPNHTLEPPIVNLP